MELIKQHRPLYNTIHNNDDPTPPFEEVFSRLVTETHHLGKLKEKDDGMRWV